jgi:phosphatidylglycerophosphate synthase
LWVVPFTDFLDGFFARRRNAETYVGGALDPIRDKLYACSKFYFLIFGFVAIYSSYPILIPLTIIIYSLLGLLELLLLGAGMYGALKGYKIKANEWGKKKFVSECFILCLIWGPVFFISLWGLSLDNTAVLILLTVLPIIPIYLALKSLNGHINAFKEGG